MRFCAAWRIGGEREGKLEAVVAVVHGDQLVAEDHVVPGPREALLAPRVTIDVMAAQLPEARLVLLRKLQAAHPFARLPEIEMRHQQPCRPAMVGLKRLPLIVERDHGLAADEIGRWHIGRVAVEGMGEHELGRRRGEGCRGENVVDQHALPGRVELRPFGDAMDVAGLPGFGQGIELRPIPFGDRARAHLQGEGPVLCADMRRRAGREGNPPSATGRAEAAWRRPASAAVR